jgi:deoxyribose-phosphate aldolase
MNALQLARLLDHSVLRPESVAADIRAGAGVVRDWRIGCYCVQPAWVKLAAAALSGIDATIACVIGFPHGCEHAATKAEAARLAVADGAGELDMVIDIGALKDGDETRVAAEISAVVRAGGTSPVKVILECAVLTDAQKRAGCRLARDAGAAFVKTSTGFHPAGGATVADVRLMRDAVGLEFGVKASGGIRTLADVMGMIDAGANRVGTSASAAILASLEKRNSVA